MKAIIFGPSSTLQLAEIDKPAPANDEVLIKVRAASVNPLDAHLLSAAPLLRNVLSSMIGLKVKRPGVDLAGEVASVGKDVTGFKPGDAVFGATAGGAFAEYASPLAARLSIKPANVSFDEAACVNVAGRTALQGLRDRARLEPGQKVLINGASGGVGTFAVQIARWLGAEVTGVCSTRNVELVRNLGADHVIDYTQEDFSKRGERYDVIFDLVGDKSLLSLRPVLTPGGTWIGAGGLGIDISLIRILPGLLVPPILSVFTNNKFVSFVTKRNAGDLDVLGQLMRDGHIKPVVDRSFDLSQANEAVTYVAGKHARGKVVIKVQSAA